MALEVVEWLEAIGAAIERLARRRAELADPLVACEATRARNHRRRPHQLSHSRRPPGRCDAVLLSFRRPSGVSQSLLHAGVSTSLDSTRRNPRCAEPRGRWPITSVAGQPEYVGDNPTRTTSSSASAHNARCRDRRAQDRNLRIGTSQHSQSAFQCRIAASTPRQSEQGVGGRGRRIGTLDSKTPDVKLGHAHHSAPG